MASALRPILLLSGSGLNQTWSFRLKKSLPASRAMRGNVMKPTHHHKLKKTSFCQILIASGSAAAPSETIRATNFEWCFDDIKVTVLLIGPRPVVDGYNGSYATREYEPFLELKGET